MKQHERSQYTVLIDSRQRVNKIVQLRLDGNVVDKLSGDIDIVVSLKFLLDKNGLTVSDISQFSAVSGEGSFTGIRVGHTIASVLNWVNGADPYNINPLKYVREPNIQIS